MDQVLRNQLQMCATQAARTLLEQEFVVQLRGLYDILPDGTIATTPGPHPWMPPGGWCVRSSSRRLSTASLAGRRP